MGGLGLTSPLWWPVAGPDFGPYNIETWPSTLGLAVQGLAVFLVAPWFVRAMVAIDRRLLFALLAPDQSQQRIAALETGRQVLEAGATEKLRRIERDLHDGTQARFVLLGLTLSRLEPRTADPESRSMIESAQQIIRDGTAELRDIIRGMRPPVLDDSLETALTSLAATSPVMTTFDSGVSTRPSDAAATALYFAAAELLSNLVRHAGATVAEIRLEESAGGYELTVCDNGKGGAGRATSGTGLDGLRRRVDALDGSLAIDSPDGGPTVIAIRLPKK